MPQYKSGISGLELLTNPFLVIEPVWVNSNLDKGDNCYNNYRVLVSKADFQVPRGIYRRVSGLHMSSARSLRLQHL